MKVLVCVGGARRKNYLLSFGRKFSKRAIRKIIDESTSKHVFHKLMNLSEKTIEVSLQDAKRVKALADFTISQKGYVAERLA